MKRILIVITTSVVEYGGLFTVMKNYLYNMDKKNFIIDIASQNEVTPELLKELENNEISYISLGSRKKNPLKYMDSLRKILKKNKYDVIHVNGNSSTMSLELCIAQKCGIKNRIAHCHTSNSQYPIINFILKPFFKQSYTRAIAVSQTSGNWLYGEGQYEILKNAIDIDKFHYDANIRELYKKKLGIENQIVLGTIGKLNGPKNHTFLLDVLKFLIDKNDKYALVLVGEGAERENLTKKVNELEIENNVTFLGARTDNAELLHVMDIFVFPSKYEGFGMALLEAQASGLPCVCSTTIPNEAKVCESVYTCVEDIDTWCSTIEHLKEDRNYSDRKRISMEAIEKITENGLNIKLEAKILKCMYEECI